MPNYMLAYHHGKMPENPEEGAEGMGRFMVWIGGLGKAVVNPGTPLGKSTTVSSDGTSEDDGPNHMMGFSIVQADNMEAAIEIAKGCPFLEMGTVGVAEMMEMPGSAS